jgi:hypothetical protein
VAHSLVMIMKHTIKTNKEESMLKDILYSFIMKINIGTMKIWFRRTRENVSVFQTFAILYLFIDKTGWRWWYPILLIPFGIFTFFDLKRGQGQETDYGFRQSKEWRTLLLDLTRIRDKVEKVSADKNGAWIELMSAIEDIRERLKRIEDRGK